MSDSFLHFCNSSWMLLVSKDAEVLKPCRGKSDNGASGFCRYHFRPHFLQHSGFRLAPASVISQVVSFGHHSVFRCFSTFFLQGILRITSSSKASGAAGSGRTGKKLEYVGLLDCWTCSNPFLYIQRSFVHTPFLLLRLRNDYPASGIPHMTPRDQVLES